ncbi:MAG: tetratricopeptide repeat protein [Candidatus Omnitrophica bacterium]|nr:tetratricopeptide repeat protein [Candidatus Omnitrophota bacterium]
MMFCIVGQSSVNAQEATQVAVVAKETAVADMRLLHFLSLKSKGRDNELKKYGVSNLMPPERRLAKIEEALQNYEMAKKLMKITNYTDARVRLNRALQIEPNFIEAHLLYADLYVAFRNRHLELKHRELADIAERTTYPLTDQRDFLKTNMKILSDIYYGDHRLNVILRNIAALIMLALIASLFTISAFHEKVMREAEYRRIMGDGTFKREETIDQLVAKMKGHVEIKVNRYKMAGVYGIPFIFFLVASNLFGFQGVLLFIFSVVPAVIYDIVIHMLYFRISITNI